MTADRFGRPAGSADMRGFPEGEVFDVAGISVPTRLVRIAKGIVANAPDGVAVIETEDGSLCWKIDHTWRRKNADEKGYKRRSFCTGNVIADLDRAIEALNAHYVRRYGIRKERPEHQLLESEATSYRPTKFRAPKADAKTMVGGRPWQAKVITANDGQTFTVPIGMRRTEPTPGTERWLVNYRAELFGRRSFGVPNLAGAFPLAVKELERRIAILTAKASEVSSKPAVITEDAPFGRPGVTFFAYNINSGALRVNLYSKAGRGRLELPLRITDVMFRQRLREYLALAMAVRDWADRMIEEGNYDVIDAAAARRIPAEVVDASRKIEITDAAVDAAERFIHGRIGARRERRNVQPKRTRGTTLRADAVAA